MKKTEAINESEIVEALNRSGYPIEQRIEQSLFKNSYYVEANSAYFDPIENKSRELDIEGITSRCIQPREKDYSLFSVVLCECINNSQPLVFFTKNSIISFLSTDEAKVSGLPVKIINTEANSENKNGYLPLMDFIKADKFHHYCQREISTQYCSFQLKKRDNKEWMALHIDEHHDSFQKLIYALEDRINHHYSSWVLGDVESTNLQFYYPVLVAQCKMYKMISKMRHLDVKDLNKTDHVLFRKEFFIRKQPENLIKKETYQIDVVTEAFFPKFLKMIDKEMEKIASRIRKRKIVIQKSIDLIVREAKRLKKEQSIRDSFEYKMPFS